MESGYTELIKRRVKTSTSQLKSKLFGEKVLSKALYTKTGQVHPKIITLGGDHTLVLPILRSLNKVYGPVSVIHFDSHLDSWSPSSYGDSSAASINHGNCEWKIGRAHV